MIMKFLWEQDVVESLDKFENGFIPMHCGTGVTYNVSSGTLNSTILTHTETVCDLASCFDVWQHYAIRCGYHQRAATIGAVLQVYSGSDGRAMIFCETKRDADELALSQDIHQETHVIHGDIPQDKREMVLKVNF